MNRPTGENQEHGTRGTMPLEAIQRLLAIGIAMDQGHTTFFQNGKVEPAPNTLRMAQELLWKVANEGYAHASAMSADLSAAHARFDEHIEAVCAALCEAGNWHEIDGDGDETSIIVGRIRQLCRQDPEWDQ